MGDYILEMKGITKTFPGVKALDNVTFQVKKGEIHSLVGENGAGKSTLMKVMSGVYPHNTYSGDIVIDGEVQRFRSIRDGEKKGVVIINQELSVVQTMNVVENIFLGHEIRRMGHIDWNTERSLATKYLKDVGLEVGIEETVGKLGTGKQQMVEIAKALSQEVRILILDEPTSSLSEKETAVLLDLLRTLRSRGITCIFISHKLNEVLDISDNITILRDGQTITTKPVSEMTSDRMITFMVGRDMKERYPRVEHHAGKTILELREWTAPHPTYPSRNLLNHINLNVKEGEILGIAGLVGAGRTELAESVYGALNAKVTGTMILDGKTHNKPFSSPEQAIKNGIAYLSEDRKRYGLVLNFDIRSNMTLSCLNKLTEHGIINKDKEIRITTKAAKDYTVKTPSIYQQVKNLSGGNQQKVAIVKSILTEPRVVFLDEPTRGIDIGAKYEIYQFMNELVEKGYGIVMISSDLSEIMGMSDRIYIMHEGSITGEVNMATDHVTQENIMYFMTGGR